MKKKILLAFAAMLVLGLAIVGFAYTRSGASHMAAACCCCSGDSCPMKKKDPAGKETASCCDNCDCCKGEHKCTGDSCPMKKKDGSANAEAKNCCCSCCGKDKERKDGATV